MVNYLSDILLSLKNIIHPCGQANSVDSTLGLLKKNNKNKFSKRSLRIQFRSLARQGKLFGIKKASW